MSRGFTDFGYDDPWGSATSRVLGPWPPAGTGRTGGQKRTAEPKRSSRRRRRTGRMRSASRSARGANVVGYINWRFPIHVIAAGVPPTPVDAFWNGTA